MIAYDLADLSRFFKRVAVKKVSKTDITKGAYVVNANQRNLLKAVGYIPGVHPETVNVSLHMLGSNQIVNASYYGSQRTGSGRTPEPRMGRFIDKLHEGDTIAFATDGNDIFICRIATTGKGLNATIKAYEETAIIANERLSIKELIRRAKKVSRKPVSQQTTTTTYYRDPAIIAFAHRRSEYNCEMPGCDYVGFKKNSGGLFIEIHHILPLSENGEDSIHNVAALCPNCHRKMHHSKDKNLLSETLKKEVQRFNKKLGING